MTNTTSVKPWIYQHNWQEIYVNQESPLAKKVGSQFLEAPSRLEAQKAQP